MIKSLLGLFTGGAKLYITVAIIAGLAGVYSYHKYEVWKAGRAGYSKAIGDINEGAKKLKQETSDAVKKLGIAECFDKGTDWEWDRKTGKCKQL